MISPVVAWMMRMSSSWMSRMIGVPAWGPADADVEHGAGVAQGDFAGGVDAVVTDTELAVGAVVAGCGFGACCVGGGGCCLMWQ